MGVGIREVPGEGPNLGDPAAFLPPAPVKKQEVNHQAGKLIISILSSPSKMRKASGGLHNVASDDNLEQNGAPIPVFHTDSSVTARTKASLPSGKIAALEQTGGEHRMCQIYNGANSGKV